MKDHPSKRKLMLLLLTIIMSIGVLLQGCAATDNSGQRNEPIASPSSVSVKSSTPTTGNKPIMIEGITIGQAENEVISKLGEPSHKEASEHSFTWYVYNNKDYVHYVQVGIQDTRVVALYTSTDNWTSTLGVKPSSTQAQVTQAHKKDQNIRSGKESASYSSSGMHVTYYFDKYNDNKIQGIQLMDPTIATSGRGRPSENNPLGDHVRTSFERQIFDLSNAARVKQGKKPFEWSDAAALSARKHSQDMAAKGYLDHTNKAGQTPLDRMKAAGINYSYAAENIAAGSSNAIEVVNGWLNSSGQRKNILGNAQMLGVGVAFGGSLKQYYTQNFYTMK